MNYQLKFWHIALLLSVWSLVSCGDDAPQDAVREIRMSVSSETGFRYVFGFEQPIECMLVMSEDHPGEWVPLDFNAIWKIQCKMPP